MPPFLSYPLPCNIVFELEDIAHNFLLISKGSNSFLNIWLFFFKLIILESNNTWVAFSPSSWVCYPTEFDSNSPSISSARDQHHHSQYWLHILLCSFPFGYRCLPNRTSVNPILSGFLGDTELYLAHSWWPYDQTSPEHLANWPFLRCFL